MLIDLNPTAAAISAEAAARTAGDAATLSAAQDYTDAAIAAMPPDSATFQTTDDTTVVTLTDATVGDLACYANGTMKRLTVLPPTTLVNWVTVGSVGDIIHNATGKTTPVDADETGIWDSVGGIFKKLTWANLKATLASTFLSTANNLSELTASASTARGNILAAKSGANSDVTSLAGLTGPIQTPTYIDMDTVAANPSVFNGRLFYDTTLLGLAYYNDVGVKVNLGAESFVRVRNTSGSTITKGSIVYVSGATGQLPTITLAQANTAATSQYIGIVVANIANNTNGYACCSGSLDSMDTSAFSDGAVVYLSASVAGGLTATEPAYPNYAIAVGVVLYSHAVNGKLLVAFRQKLLTGAITLDTDQYIKIGNVAGSQADITGHYTVAATDTNRMLNISGGSAKTITVPADTLAAAAGSGKAFMCSWNNTGAGTVTFAVSGAGATIQQMNGAAGLTAGVNRTGAIFVKSSTVAQVAGTD